MQNINPFKIAALSTFLMLIFLVSCDDDDMAGRDAVLTGETEGAIYYSDLEEPDTVINDNIHRTVKEIDIDNDGIDDISIVAEMDTIVDLNQDLTAFKRLSIIASNPTDQLVRYSAQPPTDVRVYPKAVFIRRDMTIWNTLDESPVVLSASEQNLTNGQVTASGLWNGQIRQYMGIRLIKPTEIIAWVELTVINHDNYVYVNHAAFAIE